MRFAKEAWPFVVPFPLVAAAQLMTGRPKAAAATLATGGAVLLFFRDPDRSFHGPADWVVAPADGLVTAIDLIEDPAVGPGKHRRIVTFLSVLDVHVQRCPIAGRVVTSDHRPGRKVAAFVEDIDQYNESHLTIIERNDGARVGIRQIAGLLARRIVNYLPVGTDVYRGQHLGLIKFSSRVDLIVPRDWEVLVRKGDRLQNGATAIVRPSGEDDETRDEN
ncbi:MAG: phosphatidylserine decarboxylase [Thermoanaerobaculia bacterium]|nr:phosphatidylserine decarboxylase [Thermoanaerobaculia bacterium]